MINVTIYTRNDEIVGFCSEGHAGYDNSGRDLICAAVSVLVINTINSIEQFTNDQDEVEADEDSGYIHFMLKTDEPSSETSVLLKSMVLGIQNVSKGNKKYLRLRFKEV